MDTSGRKMPRKQGRVKSSPACLRQGHLQEADAGVGRLGYSSHDGLDLRDERQAAAVVERHDRNVPQRLRRIALPCSSRCAGLLLSFCACVMALRLHAAWLTHTGQRGELDNVARHSSSSSSNSSAPATQKTSPTSTLRAESVPAGLVAVRVYGPPARRAPSLTRHSPVLSMVPLALQMQLHPL